MHVTHIQPITQASVFTVEKIMYVYIEISLSLTVAFAARNGNECRPTAVPVRKMV